MGKHSSNPNLNEYGELHIKYSQQMKYLKELADELGVVMFLPSYHAQTGDCNTVLFYFKEDDDYNRRIDKEAPKGLPPSNDMYRRQYWSFENTDCNGRFSHDFANFGRIDLRPLNWQTILRGAFELAYYRELQNRYIVSVGGILSLPEADDEYNDFNRKIISAFKKLHPKAHLGNVSNYNTLARQDLINGDIKALTEYDGRVVYNFGCDFIVPDYDEKLNDLIRDWNDEFKSAKVEDIYDRVKNLGGVYFIWR